MTNAEYIERLQMVIFHRHELASKWMRSVRVHHAENGHKGWSGNVEVFRVEHPEAKTCYAWADSHENYTVMLAIPPVTTPAEAVKMSLLQRHWAGSGLSDTECVRVSS